VANVEVDLDDLWDDDKFLLEEDDWDQDHIESDDSNCENYQCVAPLLFSFVLLFLHK